MSASIPTMPPQSFDDYRTYITSLLQEDVANLLAHVSLPHPLGQACEYAMTGSGKRVRPLLAASAFLTVHLGSTSDKPLAKTLLSQAPPSSALMAEGQPLNSACRRAMVAVELLHAYSLVHDDLPCMDDDDLRRGRPTCHIAFDEATALLAGDVLQTLSFEILSMHVAGFEPIEPECSLQLIQTFAPRARRMVNGQMLDLNAEQRFVSQADLEAIHRDKTGALIEAATLMGGISANATSAQLDALQSFAANIGLAFQVQDDILDVTASTDMLGKPAGSDQKLDKSTYVKLMGVEAANDYAKQLFETGKAAIVTTFGPNNALIALADWLWHRQK